MVNEGLTIVNVVAQLHRTKLPSIDSDGNQLGDGCMTAAAKPAVAQRPLRIVLVGEREEDFFLVREIVERNPAARTTQLEQARSLEKARVRLQQKPYALVLLQQEMGDAESVQLASEFSHAGVLIPSVLLTEDADGKTVADIMKSGTGAGLPNRSAREPRWFERFAALEGALAPSGAAKRARLAT